MRREKTGCCLEGLPKEGMGQTKIMSGLHDIIAIDNTVRLIKSQWVGL